MCKPSLVFSCGPKLNNFYPNISRRCGVCNVLIASEGDVGRGAGPYFPKMSLNSEMFQLSRLLPIYYSEGGVTKKTTG